MAYASSAFRVRDVAPDDIAWHAADEPERRSFWREVVRITLRVKGDSLSRGLDRHGLKMKPVSRWTRKHRRSAMGAADPSAPPLQPAHAASRTRAYLKGRAFADHAEFFWTNGWGKILHFHRVGARNRWAKSGRLPVRDVIGLSQADENKVGREARAWWRARHRPPVKPRTPLVLDVTPAPARVPKPVPVPVAARPPLVLPKPAPELVFPKATPRKRPALARRAGLMVRRSLDWLKGLFARKPRGF